MCGIVGYAGARPALTIVLDGLRRLEYRGYDSAGVALIADAELRHRASGPASWPTWRRPSPNAPGDARPRRGDHRHRPHPLGHPRRPHRPQRPPAPSPSGRVAVIHNGIIENFAKLRAELEASGVEFASDTDTECAAHLLERELRSLRADPARARHGRRSDVRRRRCGGSADGWRAPSPCSRSTRTPPAWSSARGATRRWWSAGATVRTSSPATSPPSSSTPARRSSWARTRSSRSPPDSHRDHRLRR